MRVSRKFSTSVQYILDQLVPPIIRDSKLFMYVPFKLVFKESYKDFMEFKNDVFSYDAKEFGNLYERTAHFQELQGETDLNNACVEAINNSLSNEKVLEVGCGRGYLANILDKSGNTVVGCDIAIPKKLINNYPKIKFVEGNIESLPFKDNSFDSVVCTHTLEHVQNLNKSISELRRIASKKLIIVIPKQRPYKYTFSLHTQFFPL